MTDAINTPQAPASGSGVDLARQALAAARAPARQRGERPSGSRKAHRARTTPQPDGREPIGFATLLTNLVTDRAWDLPSAGGSLVDEWPAVVTDLTGHVALAGYDPATGELAVRPTSSPYATAVRLRTHQLIDNANQVMGSATAVRTIRILPPGTAPAIPRPADTHPITPTPARVLTWTEPYEQPAGYREAIAQHRAHRYTHPTDTRIAQAAREQIRTRIREPETAFAQGQAEAERFREQREREESRGTAEAPAVARARAEKAGFTRLPRQATAAAPELLDRTA
ncbi:DciA family protein [Streptomyces goshikiensis]|uniref:DciA family protein n=1 Tax=Streptomyces goshikiensis TaxID=1942 RepID=UPI002ADF644F|nr:DciA family protein [Streptomyces goshikiensis]